MMSSAWRRYQLQRSVAIALSTRLSKKLSSRPSATAAILHISCDSASTATKYDHTTSRKRGGRLGHRLGAKLRWLCASKYGSPSMTRSLPTMNASARSGGRGAPIEYDRLSLLRPEYPRLTSREDGS